MPEPYSAQDFEVQQWCLGLPFVTQRLLSAEERATLRREAGRKRALCLLWPATPILFILMLIVLLSLDSGPGRQLSELFMVVSLILMVGVALVALSIFQTGIRGI